MNPLNVLIVENEILIAKHLSKYLVDQMYNISGVARTGEEALNLVEKENPDVIIMDIDLDGQLDGIQTATLIHEKLIIPIIYLTHIQDNKTFERASNTLPGTYLTKPFKNLDVKNAIEMSIKSLRLLTQNKSKDLNLSIELNIPEGNKVLEEVYSLKDRIFIRNKYGTFSRLDLDDIVYINTDDHSLIIQTLEGEKRINFVFSNFLESIKEYPIFRIHKQTAVNANYVYNLSKKEVNLEYIDSNKELVKKTFHISKAYKEEVLNNFRVVITKKQTT
jgi:DNA-binding LytR/AlgR family response regulator